MTAAVTSIDDLINAGLAPDGWEVELLRAADRAGTPDGKVSIAELDAYLANPKDVRFVSAAAVRQMRAELALPTSGGVPVRAISSFTSEWQRKLAERADEHGNHDGL